MTSLSSVLLGKNVRLEALALGHVDGLCECLLNEPDGWFARQYGLTSSEVFRQRVAGRLQANASQASFSYVTIDLKTSKVAGLSHFMKMDWQNRQLEIGGTQVGKDFRRTHVNTETKLLMLTEAFENLKFVRVYFKIDVENFVSQKSIQRIGAKLEGTFRNEWILPDGRIRDGQVYSIIDSEWPAVKRNLQKIV